MTAAPRAVQGSRVGTVALISLIFKVKLHEYAFLTPSPVVSELYYVFLLHIQTEGTGPSKIFCLCLKSDLQLKHPWSSHCGSVVMNPASIHEDVSSIPGLTQWVKDLTLPCAVAQIWCCCGCGVGWQLQLRLDR